MLAFGLTAKFSQRAANNKRSLLFRRFVFRKPLVMSRKGPWEGYRRLAKRRLARCLLPAFLCTHIFIEREREKERRLGSRQKRTLLLADYKHATIV